MCSFWYCLLSCMIFVARSHRWILFGFVIRRGRSRFVPWRGLNNNGRWSVSSLSWAREWYWICRSSCLGSIWIWQLVHFDRSTIHDRFHLDLNNYKGQGDPYIRCKLHTTPGLSLLYFQSKLHRPKRRDCWLRPRRRSSPWGWSKSQPTVFLKKSDSWLVNTDTTESWVHLLDQKKSRFVFCHRKHSNTPRLFHHRIAYRHSSSNRFAARSKVPLRKPPHKYLHIHLPNQLLAQHSSSPQSLSPFLVTLNNKSISAKYQTHDH